MFNLNIYLKYQPEIIKFLMKTENFLGNVFNPKRHEAITYYQKSKQMATKMAEYMKSDQR